MTLGCDIETDTFYCYCLDDGEDAVALIHSDGIYKCPKCGRFLTEHERTEHVALKPRAIVRFTKTGCVLVLCHLGHLIESSDLKNWAGSSMEAEVGFRHYGDRFDRLAWKCQGAGHDN